MVRTDKELLTACCNWIFSRNGNKDPVDDQEGGTRVRNQNRDRIAKGEDTFRDVWFLPGNWGDATGDDRSFNVDNGIKQLFIMIGSSHATHGELNSGSTTAADLLDHAKKIDELWTTLHLNVKHDGTKILDKSNISDFPLVETDKLTIKLLDPGDKYAQLTKHKSDGPNVAMVTAARIWLLDIKQGTWTITINAMSRNARIGTIDEGKYNINLTYTLTVLNPPN